MASSNKSSRYASDFIVLSMACSSRRFHGQRWPILSLVGRNCFVSVEGFHPT